MQSLLSFSCFLCVFFFIKYTATTELYTYWPSFPTRRSSDLFSNILLRQRINNILERRKRLQAHYCLSVPRLKNALNNREESALHSSAILSRKDQEFLTRVSTYIHDHACMESLNVEELANQMSISRSVLSRKLKALTGMSPVDYIKSIRMQMALDYLDNTNLNISEVSYNIGFSDPHYFSKCFKQMYKITPTEYVKRKQQSVESA